MGLSNPQKQASTISCNVDAIKTESKASKFQVGKPQVMYCKLANTLPFVQNAVQAALEGKRGWAGSLAGQQYR